MMPLNGQEGIYKNMCVCVCVCVCVPAIRSR